MLCIVSFIFSLKIIVYYFNLNNMIEYLVILGNVNIYTFAFFFAIFLLAIAIFAANFENLYSKFRRFILKFDPNMKITISYRIKCLNSKMLIKEVIESPAFTKDILLRISESIIDKDIDWEYWECSYLGIKEYNKNFKHE